MKFLKTAITLITLILAKIRHKLGRDFTEPPDFDEFRVVELYTRVSKAEKREDIIKILTVQDSILSLIIDSVWALTAQILARLFIGGCPVI